MKFLLVGALTLLTACSHLAYYAQLAKGQYQLLSKRESIAMLIAHPAGDTGLRLRLQKVLDARAYASGTLALPDNASYTEYADLGRNYAVWNVIAAGEFSVEPVEHCFLLVGCLAYRGYFAEADAQAEAARLRALGFDADVTGVPAYSTLGWFDDPLLSTMMHWTDEWLIGTLFHELAHQQLYVRDDTAFNESFASFVEKEGLEQYLAARGGSSENWRQLKQRQQQFVQLLLDARRRLETLYADGGEPAALRAAKQDAFAQLRRDYAELRDREWQGWNGYDRWFDGVLSNAKLVPFALYDGWVPAFAALFEQTGRNWPAFYAAAKALGGLDQPARVQRLRDLAPSAALD